MNCIKYNNTQEEAERVGLHLWNCSAEMKSVKLWPDIYMTVTAWLDFRLVETVVRGIVKNKQTKHKFIAVNETKVTIKLKMLQKKLQLD